MKSHYYLLDWLAIASWARWIPGICEWDTGFLEVTLPSRVKPVPSWPPFKNCAERDHMISTPVFLLFWQDLGLVLLSGRSHWLVTGPKYTFSLCDQLSKPWFSDIFLPKLRTAGEAHHENADYCGDFGKIILPSEKVYLWWESLWEGVAGREEDKCFQESPCGREKCLHVLWYNNNYFWE